MYCVAKSVLPWEMGRRLVYCHGQDVICPFASSEDNTGSLSIYAHRLANSSTMVVNLIAANRYQANNKTKLIFLWLPCTTKKKLHSMYMNTALQPLNTLHSQAVERYSTRKFLLYYMGSFPRWKRFMKLNDWDLFNHSKDIWLHPL